MSFSAPGVSSCAEGAESKILTSTIKLSNEQSDMQRNTEEEVKTTTQSEEQVSFNMSCEGTKEGGKLLCEQQTMQLVKEVKLCLTVHLFFFFAKPN